MGKGKGSPEYWVAQIQPGRILYEIGGAVEAEEAVQALKLAGYKLPIKTKVLRKESQASA